MTADQTYEIYAVRYARRDARIRAAMREEGLGALIVYGVGGLIGTDPYRVLTTRSGEDTDPLPLIAEEIRKYSEDGLGKFSKSNAFEVVFSVNGNFVYRILN